MKSALKKITAVTDKICYYVSFFSMAMIVLMMVMVTVDVVLKIFKLTVPGCYEICQMALATLVFSSWAYTQSVHGHIHVTMFISKFPQKLRFVCYGLTSLVSVATMVFGFIGVYSQIGSVRASGECTGTLLIPYWPFYIFEFVAMVLLAIVLLRDAIKAILAIWDREMAQEIQAEWV